MAFLQLQLCRSMNYFFAIYSIFMAILTISEAQTEKKEECGNVLKFIARDLIKKTAPAARRKITVDDFIVVGS